MKIKDIMSKIVQMVSPDTSLQDVASKMQQSDCGSVLVAMNDRLLGVITDRDIAMRCVAEGQDASGMTAEDVMTKQILYCRDTDSVEDIALDMSKNMVRRMPVLDQHKRLVGIVSLGDLAANSTDHHHLVCGRALGFICAVPGDESKVAGHA